jgi:uncharacterized protein
MHASALQTQALQNVLAAQTLRLAVLFGSQATGLARADSDFDIGILPQLAMSLAEELALASALSAATRTEVDLVRLDQDNPLLAGEVARTARCLYECAPGEFSRYRARAMSIWIDFEETIAVHRNHRLRRLAERV